MYDVGKVDDPNSFREAVSCENSAKWVEAMEEELKSMSSNDVWNAVNGSTRLNVILKGMSNDSKQDS